jgi:hypothetical protein
MIGRWGRWGSTEPVPSESYTQLASQFLVDVSPHLESFSALSETITDPARQIAVLESQLQSARRSGASLQQITLLEGKLNAAKIRLQRRQEGDTSLATWRNFGIVGAGVGIALGAALTFLVLVRALASTRRTR